MVASTPAPQLTVRPRQLLSLPLVPDVYRPALARLLRLGGPPDDVSPRLRDLMAGLRSDFGGPEFGPHITISLTEEDALTRFRAACEGLKAYEAIVNGVGTGSIYWQCVYLLINMTEEVVPASDRRSRHFGYLRSSQCVSLAQFPRGIPSEW